MGPKWTKCDQNNKIFYFFKISQFGSSPIWPQFVSIYSPPPLINKLNQGIYFFQRVTAYEKNLFSLSILIIQVIKKNFFVETIIRKLYQRQKSTESNFSKLILFCWLLEKDFLWCKHSRRPARPVRLTVYIKSW